MTQGPPTHDELIDQGALGAEPSADYLKHVEILDNVVREAICVSRGFSGIASPTSKHFYASVLYTAMITRSVSLAQLVPFSPWAEKEIEHWDYSSATGIARTILELRLAFYYLCVDTCTDDEWNCRWNLFNLHDCTSRIRLFQAMSAGSEQVSGLTQSAEELKERLRANPFFCRLADGQQRKLLNGQTAYLMSLEEIAERSGLDKESFRWMYVLFSSHVHALPMSFYRMGGEHGDRGRGLPSPTEEGYTGLCLSLVVSLLVSVREEINQLFGDFKKRTDDLQQQERVLADSSATEIVVPSLAIGEIKRFTETDEVIVDVKRISEDGFEFEYRDRATGEVVLRRLASDDGSGLYDMDPYFWTVLLNQGPAVEKQLVNMNETRHAFKVDVSTRTVHFKVEHR